MSSSALVAVTVQVVAPPLASSTVSSPVVGLIEQSAVPSATVKVTSPVPLPPVVSRSRVEP